MRNIITVLLISLASLAAHADGFAYGKSFFMLRETDQAVVIDMGEDTVDVSMYIAIGGIPPGETITYVLPFWYRPDAFTMTEMEPRDYRAKYVVPAVRKVVRMNRIAEGNASMMTLKSAGFFGLGFTGPFLPPVSPFFREGPRQGMTLGVATSSPQLVPYDIKTTAHARAELYKITAKDLQQLVAQAGLPLKYAEPLKKYKTPYFAVMRLTGAKNAKDEQEAESLFSNQGVCYRFRHPVPPDWKGEYIYPLGTGAAWPKPITLTEVYVTCPDAWALKVAAPVAGKREEADTFYWNLHLLQDLPRLQFSEGEKAELLSAKTAGLLDEDVTAPSAWHAAYFNSNPSEDIVVNMTPRPAPWRLRLAESLMDPEPSFLCAGLFMIISWTVACLVVVRPRWVRAGRPGLLLGHTLLAMLSASFWFSLVVVLLVVLRAVVSGFIQGFDFSWDIASVLYAVQAFSVIALGFVALLMVARSLSRAGSQPEKEPAIDWRKRLGLHSWLLATAIYLALNGGLYWFVRWCEAAM